MDGQVGDDCDSAAAAVLCQQWWPMAGRPGHLAPLQIPLHGRTAESTQGIVATPTPTATAAAYHLSSIPCEPIILMDTDAMMAQFLGGAHDGNHCSFGYEQQDESMEAMAAMFLPGLDAADSNSSSSCLNYDVQCWPQLGLGHSSSVTSFLDPAHSYESFEFPVIDSFPPHADFEPHCAAPIPYLGDDLSPLHANDSSTGGEEPADNRTPATTNKRKSGAAAMAASKKAKKAGKKGSVSTDDGGDGDGAAAYIDPQSSSSCTSEEGNVEGSTKSSSKKTGTRAGRGAATDPQSLYARKRRERINEKLRILQNLVPNGTKVDISTMLEEAVQYVKFMQLQIKLLSSDDTWMYAPLAYNGFDVSNVDLNMYALRK